MSNKVYLIWYGDAVVGVASDPQRREVIEQGWKYFVDSPHKVKTTSLLAAAANSKPRNTIFGINTRLNKEGVSVEDLDNQSTRINVEGTSLHNSNLGKVHLDPLMNGKFHCEVYLRGSDFSTIEDMVTHAKSLFSEAMLAFIEEDVSQPIEQSKSLGDLIVETIRYSPFNHTMLTIIRRFSDYSVKDVTEAVLHEVRTNHRLNMDFNGVLTLRNFIPSPSPANLIQDQSSSEDGQVIL